VNALPDPSVPLAPDEAADAFALILEGKVGDDALASFLVALADRGETVTEIVAAATQLRLRQSFGPQASTSPPPSR
jgi:anthranilate phosphoribosyltransferase